MSNLYSSSLTVADFESSVGVWIDGERMTVAEGDMMVIEHAMDVGFTVSTDDWAAAWCGLEWGCESGDEDTLRWLSEEAETFLNDTAPDGYSFGWESGSFFLNGPDSDEEGV